MHIIFTVRLYDEKSGICVLCNKVRPIVQLTTNSCRRLLILTVTLWLLLWLSSARTPTLLIEKVERAIAAANKGITPSSSAPFLDVDGTSTINAKAREGSPTITGLWKYPTMRETPSIGVSWGSETVKGLLVR